MLPKPWNPMEEIAQMNEGQLEGRKGSLEDYFNACRQEKQGINSKERAWYHAVCDRLEKEFGWKITRWQ